MKLLSIYYFVITLAIAFISRFSGLYIFSGVEYLLYGYLPMVVFLLINSHKLAIIERESNSRKRKCLTLKLKRFNFFMSKITNLLVFLILVASIFNIPFSFTDKFALVNALNIDSKKLLLLITIGSMVWFVMFVTNLYLSEKLRVNSDKFIKEVYQILYPANIIIAIIMVNFIAEYLKFRSFTAILTLVFMGVNLLLIIEFILRFVAIFFTAKRKNELRRPLFNSYLLEIIASPTKSVGLLKDTINRQLGFEFSSSQFFRAVASSIVPIIFFSILLWWLLSSVVILQPNEEAVVLKFGKIEDKTFKSGLNFKLPFPIETIRKFDVWQIRRVRVGSHQVTDENADIYLSNIPILWTNNHGVSDDELLIVAPPSDMMKEINPDDKTPSISLVGADITIEYRIRDIKKFLVAGENVDQYFKSVAMKMSSSALFQFDVDALFCLGRIELPKVLKKELQSSSDNLELGLEILHVGIGGVHPPQKVAEYFQSTVASLQMKETMIEEAKKYEIQKFTELTGSIDRTKKLMAINELTLKDAEDCDGTIAYKIAEAKSYRCLKINSEAGKSLRFSQESLLYNAAPKTYLNECVMSTLEDGLRLSYKYILVGKNDKLMLRFNLEELTY